MTLRPLHIAALIACAGLGATGALAEPAANVAKPADAGAMAITKARYTVADTSLGTMLDDPAAKAILTRHIPDVVGNPNIDMGRSMTLAQLKAYAGDVINDEALAKIQAELDASAPK